MIYARLTPDLASVDRAGIEISDAEYAALQANGKAAWLRLYVVDAKPVPSATQRIETGPYVTDATTTRKTWLFIDKTQEELDAEALAASQAATLVQLKAAISALQTDVQAGITPAPTTAAQAFVEIQDLKRRMLRADRVLLWLLRQQQ